MRSASESLPGAVWHGTLCGMRNRLVLGAIAFAIYVTLMAAVYPVFYAFFAGGRGWSRVATGALLGLFCGFLWDALQGGIIEYATYNVSLPAMLVDSAYHTAEGVLAGVIIGALYRPTAAARARSL
jgi:hypothetical protein